MTRANTPREPSPGYDWRQLTLTHHVPGRATTRTTDTTAKVDRYDDFRLRIRRGVTTVVCHVIDREPLSSAPNTFIKSVAATTPIPKYGGNDNLEEFRNGFKNSSRSLISTNSWVTTMITTGP